MARTTMAALLARLRRLVSDPAGAEQTWSDEELQDALDEHQCVYRYARLMEEESRAPVIGVVTYKRFHTGGIGDWESDVEIVNATWSAVTPTSSDLINGRWEFASEPDWPLYINGKTYDLYGAAADILEAWAAKKKCQVDFSSEGQSMKLSQQANSLFALAQTYRQKQKPAQGSLSRSDIR